MGKIAGAIIEKARELIQSTAFCERHKKTKTCFTRKRCMDFKGVMTLCLNFIRRSLQVEIDHYMELTDPDIEKPMSKQAFSKARHKISPEAFKELFEASSQTALESDGIGRYKGYRVFAIDGTELQMPKNEEMTGLFKQTRGSFSPHGRASILCDVITGMTIHAAIDSIAIDERSLAKEHLAYFEAYKQVKDLIVFDRGYPSKKLIEYLESHGFKYLMRLQRSFNAEIDNAKKRDFYVCISGVHVRVIKLTLPSGETEILITNLGRKAFKTADFMELYHLRWGIETKYNTLKNKLDWENFSGRTMVTVLQDFYATLFLSNIAASLKAEADAIIQDDNAEKSLKHSYMANENLLIGKLKDKLIMILLNDNATRRAYLLDKLVAQIARYRTAVVPDRHFDRPATSHKKTCCKTKKAL